MVGDADDVANALAGLSKAGLPGALFFSFVNYLDEFPYFGDEVLPRLARLRLREKHADIG